MIGYDKPLYILPFDHRGSFLEKMFGIKDREPTSEEAQKVREMKQIIYEGFKKSLTSIPKDYGAILVDEQFGDDILKDALTNGVTTLVTTEKSGQKEFDFEYGADFGEHLKKYNPTFAKALVRYNVEEDPEMNKRQLTRLKELSDFCHANNIKLLIEPLVPATPAQLERVGGDVKRYDDEIRPELVVRMIKEFQDAGVEVDVWKLEGMEKKEDYAKAIAQARSGNGRENVGIVVLGRGAGPDQVRSWIKAGVGVPGVIGLAVGRTVFWDPLVEYKDGSISKEEAASKISDNFLSYCQLFKS